VLANSFKSTLYLESLKIKKEAEVLPTLKKKFDSINFQYSRFEIEKQTDQVFKRIQGEEEFFKTITGFMKHLEDAMKVLQEENQDLRESAILWKKEYQKANQQVIDLIKILTLKSGQ
jgi:hypothetical protein